MELRRRTDRQARARCRRRMDDAAHQARSAHLARPCWREPARRQPISAAIVAGTRGPRGRAGRSPPGGSGRSRCTAQHQGAEQRPGRAAPVESRRRLTNRTIHAHDDGCAHVSADRVYR